MVVVDDDVGFVFFAPFLGVSRVPSTLAHGDDKEDLVIILFAPILKGCCGLAIELFVTSPLTGVDQEEVLVAKLSASVKTRCLVVKLTSTPSFTRVDREDLVAEFYYSQSW